MDRAWAIESPGNTFVDLEVAWGPDTAPGKVDEESCDVSVFDPAAITGGYTALKCPK